MELTNDEESVRLQDDDGCGWHEIRKSYSKNLRFLCPLFLFSLFFSFSLFEFGLLILEKRKPK